MPIDFSRRWRLNELLFPRSQSQPQELTAALSQVVVPAWDLFMPRVGECYLRSFSTTGVSDGLVVTDVDGPEPPAGRMWVVHRLSSRHSGGAPVLGHLQVISTTSTRDPWNAWFDQAIPANRSIQTGAMADLANGMHSLGYSLAPGLIIMRGSLLRVSFSGATGAALGAGVTCLFEFLFIDVPGETLPLLTST